MNKQALTWTLNGISHQEVFKPVVNGIANMERVKVKISKEELDSYRNGKGVGKDPTLPHKFKYKQFRLFEL